MPIDQWWRQAWEPDIWWLFHNAVNWIYIHLHNLAEDIEGVPFLGEYLVIPFRWFTRLVLDVLDGIHHVAYSWRQTWWFIHDLIEGDVFLQLLGEWGYDWFGLLPKLNQWIWQRMEDLLETWLSWFVDLTSLLYDSIVGVAPWFPAFVESPYDWFRGVLLQDFGPLYWFWIDPMGYVTGEIYRLFPVTKYIFDDPVDWLKYRLSDIFGVDKDFWDDPLESIKASIQLKLIDMIEEARDDLYPIGERLFRYFLEEVW